MRVALSRAERPVEQPWSFATCCSALSSSGSPRSWRARAMERIGQTAVLGELLAGVIIGPGVLGLVHESEALHALAELGVLILLFEVGLESDLRDLLRAGLQATLVALVGVVVPFAVGLRRHALARPPSARGRVRRGDAHRDQRRYHGARARRPRSSSGRCRQGRARGGRRGRHPRSDHPRGGDRDRANRRRLGRRRGPALREGRRLPGGGDPGGHPARAHARSAGSDD